LESSKTAASRHRARQGCHLTLGQDDLAQGKNNTASRDHGRSL
jgi:hypothetical protein